MGVIKAPVTALGISEDFLFAGVGSFVRIFSKSTRKIIFIKKILSHHVVHGFKFLNTGKESYVIVYGGRELCLCQLNTGTSDNENNAFITIISILKTHDWIWDIAFIFEHNSSASTAPRCIALALSHNFVLLYDWKEERIVTESHCEEKCILYSGHFMAEERPTWDSLTLCSGTVFNQVVIWKPGSVEDATSKARILERIEAHDGVIFSMNFDFKPGLLVTASDDRSIRLWTCESLRHFWAKTPRSSHTVSTKCLCKLYGHESRVWRARGIYHGPKLYLISIGEDGCCIIWDIVWSESDEMLNGKVVRKMRCHKGRNIWSLAIDQKQGYIATGGGDAGIRLWSLQDQIEDTATIIKHPFQVQNVEDSSDFGTLKSIHMCNEKVIFGHTDAGILLRFDVKKSAWTVLHSDNNFKSYAIMRICDQVVNMVAIGNTKGEVCLLHLDDLWKTSISKSSFTATSKVGKIHNMSWCICDCKPYLFISGTDGEFLCYGMKFDNSRHSGESFSCVKQSTWLLPLARHRWLMGAVFLGHHDDTKYVLCGDRRGSLHLCKQGVLEPLDTLHGVHGKNGVTSVRNVGKAIISTGRDGIWRKLDVDFSTETIKILAQNRAAQGMDWLESAVPIPSSLTGSAILGFHGRNFTVWSSVTGDILLSIECGGGHRDWTFKVQNNKSYLAFIKESTLNLATIQREVTEEVSVVESHFHGGQITSIKCIDSYHNSSDKESVTFFATGSEDTKVYISALLSSSEVAGESKLNHVCLIDDHISSVRALAPVNLERNEHNTTTVLFSGGGRATINCYFVKIDKRQSNWTESCSVEHLTSHRLNAKAERSKVKEHHAGNPETRYMDLTAWRKGSSVLLAAACSDAVIRVFSVELESKEMHLLAQSANFTHCFLTINCFKVENTTYIVSGATDGFIRIWLTECFNDSGSTLENGTKLQPPCLETQVHMSGINAMDTLENAESFFSIENFHPQSQNLLLLATGGDDNAIHLKLQKFRNGEIDVLTSYSIEKAHSTQITGLKFSPSKHAECMELLSTSIDQRLTKWKISLRENVLSCEFSFSVLTNIADVSSLEVWRPQSEYSEFDTCYAVCGQGIQIFDTELK